MVEVVLKDDITRYKPKFLFGLTARQAVVLAIGALIVAAEAYLLYFRLNLGLDVAGWVIVLSAATVVLIGLKQVDGVYMTKLLVPYLRYYFRPKVTEHVNPELTVHTDIPYQHVENAPVVSTENLSKHEKKALEKAEKKAARELKKDLKEAKCETEYVGEDGRCIKPTKAAKARNITPIKKSKKEKPKKSKKSKKKTSENTGVTQPSQIEPELAPVGDNPEM